MSNDLPEEDDIFSEDLLEGPDQPEYSEDFERLYFDKDQEFEREKAGRRKDQHEINKLVLQVTIAIMAIMTIVFVGGMTHTLIQVSNFASELRDKGERISKLEAQLPFSPFD